MKYPKPPQTPRQWGTIAGVLVMLAGFLMFLWYEIPGIVNDVPEDTFSEWVWDLSWFSVLLWSLGGAILCLICGWFALHAWEGWIERRRRERG